ncbi:hypothetical protein PsYK624_062540 [Phanerochaete sordida]|uniref:Uncharacterized protein n=1 Tax=Phanerochaete sordida TaxID=48140 RepID=A0A9P3LCD4_9APHY|nr:hypothetical protein PsYK624_062540 [Phanerochaete sordida]
MLYSVDHFRVRSIYPSAWQNVRRISKHPGKIQETRRNEIEGVVIDINYTQANGMHYLDELQYLSGELLHEIVSGGTRTARIGVLNLDPYAIRYNSEASVNIYGKNDPYDCDVNEAFKYSCYSVTLHLYELGLHSRPSSLHMKKSSRDPGTSSSTLPSSPRATQCTRLPSPEH